MNKKILMSLGAVTFVAAVVISATGAFFNDTETSTGNTFTAGALDLLVDSQAHFNGLVCVDEDGDGFGTWQNPVGADPVGPEHFPQPGDPCTGTWAESDLIAGAPEFRFFDFLDLKPGDEGENTISLHVTDNDAWGCFLVDNVVDDDVSCTEPESESTDPECSQDPAVIGDGELGAFLTFDAWLDEGFTPGFQCNNPADEATAGAGCEADPGEGNNILDETERLFWDDQTVDEAAEGPFAMSDILATAAAIHQCEDPTGHTDYTLCHGLAADGRMVGSVTYYWGLAWNIPDDVGNEIQTDAITMDMIFEVEQHRNNPGFVCTDPEPEPESAALTVDKIVTFTNQSVVGVDVNDFELHIAGPNGDQIVVDEVEVAGLPSGVYTITEIYSNDPANVTFNAAFSGACSEVDDTGVGTMTLNPGDDVTCTITNSVTEVTIITPPEGEENGG